MRPAWAEGSSQQRDPQEARRADRGVRRGDRAGRAAAREHRARRPRQAGGGQARPLRPLLPRARAVRGRARDGEDRARPRDRAVDRGRARLARAVHARPPADRRHRALGLQPEGARVRVPPGAGLREHRPRRRDQPRDAAHAVGAARGDGRAPDHRGRRVARRCPTRSSSSRRRTRSTTRGRSRSPRRSSTASSSRRRSATRTQDDELEIVQAQLHAPPARRARAGIDVAELRRIQAAVEDVYIDPILQRWLIELVRATRELDARERRRLGARLARARARGARAGRSRTGGRSSSRRTSRRSSSPCSSHRVLLNPYRLESSSNGDGAGATSTCSRAASSSCRARASRSLARWRRASRPSRSSAAGAASGSRAARRRALHRGRGFEIASSRPYQRGDSMRAIDWKASARLVERAARRTSSSSASTFAEESPRVVALRRPPAGDGALSRRSSRGCTSRRRSPRPGG